MDKHKVHRVESSEMQRVTSPAINPKRTGEDNRNRGWAVLSKMGTICSIICACLIFLETKNLDLWLVCSVVYAICSMVVCICITFIVALLL